MKIFLHQHIYHAVILVVLIALLTACSSTRLIYTFMDKFIQDEITYFLDLDEEEEVLLSQQVSEMIAWHRTSILPSYATYLNNMAEKLEVGQYGVTDVAESIKDGRFLIEETVIGLTPYASKFLIQHQTVAVSYTHLTLPTKRIV